VTEATLAIAQACFQILRTDAWPRFEGEGLSIPTVSAVPMRRQGRAAGSGENAMVGTRCCASEMVGLRSRATGVARLEAVAALL